MTTESSKLGLSYSFNSDLTTVPGQIQMPTFGSSLHHSQPPSLSLDYSFQQGQNGFGVSSAYALNREANRLPTFKDFLQAGGPKPEEHVGRLAFDTADTALDLTHLSKLANAMDAGKALQEVAKASAESGKNGISKMEAIACKTAGLAANQAISQSGAELIVGGLAGYLEECVAFPPLAATIPAVGKLLPQAYANVEHIADFTGKKVEEFCHDQFSK